MSGDNTLRGEAYGANAFFQPPYTTGRGRENETRQLQVEQTDGGWLISKDLGAVPS